MRLITPLLEDEPAEVVIGFSPLFDGKYNEAAQAARAARRPPRFF